MIFVDNSRVFCGVDRFTGDSVDFGRPACEEEGILRGARLFGCLAVICRRAAVTEIVVLKHRAVVVFKGYRVVVEYFIKVRSVNGVIEHHAYFLVPTVPHVGVLRIACLNGCFTRKDRNCAVVNRLLVKHGAVLIDEFDRIFVYCRVEARRVRNVARYDVDILIPALKGVGVLRGFCLNGCFAGIDGHCAVVEHLLVIDFAAVLGHELNGVFVERFNVLCSVFRIARYGCNFAPILKGVGKLNVGRFNGCCFALVNGSFTVIHRLLVEHLTVVVFEDYGVGIDCRVIYRRVVGGFGDGFNFIVPACERIGILRGFRL